MDSIYTAVLNKIWNCHNMDIKLGLPSLPDNTIDLSIQSPPYNLNIDYDEFDDNQAYEEYLTDLEDVFREVFRVTVNGGRCCINVGDKQNGKVPIHSDIIQIMQSIGWLPYSTIIWDKQNVSNRMAVGSWCSPSSPSFPTPFEYILIFAKGLYKKSGRKEDITINKQDFMRDTLAIWRITPETRSEHPAPFPISIPFRLINLLSFKGDVVADFYSGSGTTAIASIKLGRNFFGYELSDQYHKMSTDRIRKEQEQLMLFP